MKQKSVVIIANRNKTGVTEAVREAETLLGQYALVLGVFFLPDEIPLEMNPDFAFVFGGDGTLLAAGRMLEGKETAIVGVNFGKLGFLTEFTHGEYQNSIPKILNGEYATEDRLVLRGFVENGGAGPQVAHALNDLVISRGASTRMVLMTLMINGETVTTYRADGLIISTPSGSTGHSMAAGGPILLPEMKAFVITPICPHTLSTRPLVVPSESLIQIRLSGGKDQDAFVSVDGQERMPIGSGGVLTVEKSPKPWTLVLNPEISFFKTLQIKLNWRGYA